MKKLICAAAIAAMICPCAHAAVTESDNSANTIVSTTINSEYQITIPPMLSVEFNDLRTDLMLTVNQMRLEPGKKLALSINTNGGKLSNSKSPSATLPFKLMKDDAVVSKLSFDRASSQTVQLQIEKSSWNAAPAGSYSGTITFTAGIE